MNTEEILKELQAKFDDAKAQSDKLNRESLDALKADVSKAIEDAQKESKDELLKELKKVSDQVVELQKSEVKIPEEVKNRIENVVKENFEAITDAIKGKKDFEVKVAAPYMNSNGTISMGTVPGLTSDTVDYSRQLVTIRHPENIVLDNFPTIRVESVSSDRVLTEQATEEGAIAITAEGAVKPLVSDTFVKTITSRVKIAGHIEWSEEFEKDHNALLIAIFRLFENKVWRKFDNEILQGVIDDATAYVGSTMDGQYPRPDNALAAIALATQIRQLEGNADIIFMNHADITATKYVQNADGTPINQSGAVDLREGSLAGMRLVGSNKIPKGTILVGESRSYLIEYENPTLKTGYINDQLIKNMFTMIGEMYALPSIAEMDKKYWIKGDLDVIKTALQKEPATGGNGE